jgi:hypothetical protein
MIMMQMVSLMRMKMIVMVMDNPMLQINHAEVVVVDVDEVVVEVVTENLVM